MRHDPSSGGEHPGPPATVRPRPQQRTQIPTALRVRLGQIGRYQAACSDNEKAPREPWPKPQPSRDSRPFGAGPGTRLRVESCQRPKPPAGCDPKIADGPKTASPRLREDGASRETRRPGDRSTIPKDPRPIVRSSPMPSVSRWLRETRTVGIGMAFAIPPRRFGPRRRVSPAT